MGYVAKNGHGRYYYRKVVWKTGKVLFCNLCKKDINHDKGGINQVNQHVLSLKDKKAWQSLQPDPNLQTTFKTTEGNIQLTKLLNICYRSRNTLAVQSCWRRLVICIMWLPWQIICENVQRLQCCWKVWRWSH